MVNLEIYPNPATKFLTINTGNSTSFTNTIQVFDMTGRMVSINRFNGNSTKLDVSNLHSGNYIIKVTASDGEIVQSKFVVTKN